MKKQKNKNFIQYEQRIIDAFIKLSKKNKWEEPSITDIVNEAKMTRPTFYLHFKSINDIYKKLEDQLLSKYMSYFSKDLKERSADILQSNIELSNIAKANKDMFKCFVYSPRFNAFIIELTNKLSNSISINKNTKDFYAKADKAIGWWDWLNTYTIIQVHFNTAAAMIRGELDIDFDFLAYWCANIAYKVISDTWARIGIKVAKHDYLKEYLDKKNKE